MKKLSSIILCVVLTFSGFDTSVSALASDFEGCEQAVVNAWKNFEQSVDISAYNIPISDIGDVYSKIIDRNSEYFYIYEDFDYDYVPGANYISTLSLTYFGTEAQIKAKQTAFNEKVNEIINLVDENWSDLEKCLFLHDYIASHNKYDLRVYRSIDLSGAYETHTAYGCLVENFSVCQGISRAFLYLSRLIGIEAYSVKSFTMSHEWNMVKLDDKFYHIDCTWDAPIIVDDANKMYCINGYVYHETFLKTDSQMKELGYHDWSIDYKSKDEYALNSEDIYWIDSKTPFIFYGDDIYYISSNTLYKRTAKTNVVSTLYTIPNGLWKGSIGKEYYWKGETARLCADYEHNFIMISGANCVYLYNTKNGSLVNAYRATTKTGYIFGLGYQKGTLFYDTKDLDKNSKTCYSTEHPITLSFPDENILFGDADDNGSINIADVLAVKKYLAGFSVTINTQSADVYYDGVINIKDSFAMQKTIANE